MKYNLDSNYVNSQHSDCDSSEGKLRSKLPKKVDEILELNAMKEIDVVSVLNADVLSGKSAFIVNKSPMDAAYEDSVTIPTFHNTVPVKKRKRSPQASKIAFFTGDDVPDKIDPDFTSLDDQYGEDNRHNYYDRAIAMPTLPIVDLHVRGAASKKKISVENPIDQKNRSQRTSSSSPSITATSVGSLLYKPHYML